MSHVIYRMKGDDPAPQAGGDTKSWFYYYKWNTEEPVFVPVDLGFRVTLGDFIWFILDGIVLGYARVSLVQLDESRDRKEVWFHSAHACRFPWKRWYPFESTHLPKFLVKKWMLDYFSHITAGKPLGWLHYTWIRLTQQKVCEAIFGGQV